MERKISCKLLSLLLAVAMIFSMIPATAMAAEDGPKVSEVTPTPIVSEGTSTVTDDTTSENQAVLLSEAEHIYEINNENDYFALVQAIKLGDEKKDSKTEATEEQINVLTKVSGYTAADATTMKDTAELLAGVYVKINDAELTLTGDDFSAGNIGLGTYYVPFTGVVDGQNNKVVYDINVNTTNKSSNCTFGFIAYGGSSLSHYADEDWGGMSEDSNVAVVRDLDFTGNINLTIGGASAPHSGVTTETEAMHIGAIVARTASKERSNDGKNSISINNCESTVKYNVSIAAGEIYLGGLIGYTGGAVLIQDSSHAGDISVEGNGDMYVGGLIGSSKKSYLYKEYSGIYNNDFILPDEMYQIINTRAKCDIFTKTLTSNDVAVYMGGFIGHAAEIGIRDSIVVGFLNTSVTSSNCYNGGIVGLLEGVSSDYERVYIKNNRIFTTENGGQANDFVALNNGTLTATNNLVVGNADEVPDGCTLLNPTICFTEDQLTTDDQNNTYYDLKPDENGKWKVNLDLPKYELSYIESYKEYIKFEVPKDSIEFKNDGGNTGDAVPENFIEFNLTSGDLGYDTTFDTTPDTFSADVYLTYEDRAFYVYEDITFKDNPSTGEVTPITQYKITGATVTMGDPIGLNFQLEYPELSETETLTVKIEQTGDYVNSKKGVETFTISADNPLTSVTVPVDAKEMIISFNATLYYNNSEDGSTELKSSRSQSVKHYLEQLLSDDNSTEATKNAAIAMLNYGGYAQEYLGFYNTQKIANETVNSDLVNSVLANVVEKSLMAYPSYKNELKGYINYYGTSVLMEGRTVLRHYFIASKDTPDSYIGTCSVASETGTVPTPSEWKSRIADVFDTEGNKTGERTYYYLELEGIPAHEMGDVKILTLTNAERTGSLRVNYSVYGYIYEILQESESMTEEEKASMTAAEKANYDNMINVAKAMFLYGEAAKAYAESLQSGDSTVTESTQ